MVPKHTTPLDSQFDDGTIFTIPKPGEHEIGVEYRIVPSSAHETAHPEDAQVQHWRVQIAPVGVKEVMALEIRADTVVGSNNNTESDLDVNVAQWNGYENGVSRRHVLLRPSKNKLFAMDLRSTNGTHINGLPLGVGWAYAIRDGDLLTLGRLHIRVRITQMPEQD